MGLGQLKVPALVATGLICFALGGAVGVAAMTCYGYRWSEPAAPAEGPPTASGGNMALMQVAAVPRGMGGGPPGMGSGRAGGGPPGMGGGPPGMGGGPPGGGGGGRGPSAKNQLASLVAKLDQLTSKPLAVHLTEEQRTKLREQLQGLGDKDDLSDDDAKKRLEAALEVVKGDKETLEAAGYRWPGERGGGRPPADVPNPFKDDANAKHLKALEGQLTKATKEG